jgi:uncharacterized membrane protein YidH (DUF202 family)
VDKPALPPDEQPPVRPLPQLLARTKSAPAPVVPRQGSPWYKDKLGDALVLGGVAATVVALVEYRGALSDLDTAEDMALTTNRVRYSELVDRAHSKRTTSVVLVGAGGALLVAGIIRYVLHDGTMDAHTVGVAPARGGGVVTYEGRLNAAASWPNSSLASTLSAIAPQFSAMNGPSARALPPSSARARSPARPASRCEHGEAGKGAAIHAGGLDLLLWMKASPRRRRPRGHRKMELGGERCGRLRIV